MKNAITGLKKKKRKKNTVKSHNKEIKAVTQLIL